MHCILIKCVMFIGSVYITFVYIYKAMLYGISICNLFMHSYESLM